MSIENIKESECEFMKRFNFWLRLELFNRIKLEANIRRIPVSQMIIEMLELGYIEYLKSNKSK